MKFILKKWYYIFLILLLLIVISCLLLFNSNNNIVKNILRDTYFKGKWDNLIDNDDTDVKEDELDDDTDNNTIIKDNSALVKERYNNYVMTVDKSIIYTYNDDKFSEVGSIEANVELVLHGIVDEYFLITGLDSDYYIKYTDVKKIDNISSYSDRFTRYIEFNESAVTEEKTLLYDDKDNLIFTFNKGLKLPIIIKEENKYGIKYNNRLLYIHSDECNIVESHNTDLMNTKGISVLNYHFFYDDSSQEDTSKCNQDICESISNFKKQLDYIKDNNFFTPTMEELEMYIDGKIQLPKSVVITIDDGWRADIGTKILTEYQLNATLFLITAWYDPNAYRSEYVEVHSHGDNIHEGGYCSGGQGGAIKCMEHDKLLLDLETSRNKLNGSKYFCYPFYEYNNYSINLLKEAGFSMAFGGEYENGYKYIVPGIDKYRLPRYVIVNYNGIETFKSYLNLY